MPPIEKPGIYDFPSQDYFNDTLTPEPALSRGGIVTLLNETPAHFAARNPRLSQWPDRVETPSREQDLGSVCHALLLGKGAAIDVHEFPDWRTKAAQAARDASREAGRVPILGRVFNDASLIVEAAEGALRARFGGWPIGDSEQIVIWKKQTDHGTIWCRTMDDHFSHKAATIIDLKTTGRSLSDEEITKKMAFDGLDIQAAFYTEGINTIYPELAGLTQFVFAFVETEPPYSVRFKRISESWMTRARFRIEWAANLFAKCLRSNEWPAWPIDETPLSAPSWLESKWEAAELLEVEA